MTDRIVDSGVVVTGSAGIEDVQDLRTRLIAALKSSDAVSINLSGIGDTDISFLQLVESARLSAAEMGKALSLAYPANDALRHDLQRGGFVARPADRAFWLHAIEEAP